MKSSRGISAQNGKLFDGLVAWFSKSVSGDRVNNWVENGGTCTEGIGTAMYVFSEDASSDDTEPLYRSEAYMDEHLAIFHASYVDACLHEDDMKKVVLGQYFLPPCEIQKVICEFTGECSWKFDETTNDPEHHSQANASVDKNLTSQSASSGSQQKHSGKSVPSTCTGYVSVDDLPKWEGELTDFIVGRDGCQVFYA